MSTTILFNNQPVTSGNDFLLNLTLLTDGVPTDITGATLTASFEVAGTEYITAHAVTIVSAAAGTCSITVTAAENDMVAGTCQFDVKMVKAGVVRHFGPGQFTVRTALT